MVYTQTCRQNTHAHKTKTNKSFRIRHIPMACILDQFRHFGLRKKVGTDAFSSPGGGWAAFLQWAGYMDLGWTSWGGKGTGAHPGIGMGLDMHWRIKGKAETIEMSLWVKWLSHKHGGWAPSRELMMGRESWLHKVVLWTPHMHCSMSTPTHILHTHQ